VSVVEEGRTHAGAKGLGRWLARIAPRSARGTVAIAILPDSRVRALNRKYRRKNRGTDVLSFPGGETGSDAIFGRDTGKLHPTPFLGDIAISRGIAQKQAKLLGHSLSTELRVLALHGLLHLLGYDHDSDNGRMARVEARLRRKARLPPGLIARSS
jgi:probable rRNA maturation factor